MQLGKSCHRCASCAHWEVRKSSSCGFPSSFGSSLRRHLRDSMGQLDELAFASHALVKAGQRHSVGMHVGMHRVSGLGMAEAVFNTGQEKVETVLTAELKGKTGLDALFRATPTSAKSEGLIAAYQKDPQKFRRYAEIFDSAMNAKQVGDVVLEQDISDLSAISESVPMEPKLKVDAWGSPFCIIPSR